MERRWKKYKEKFGLIIPKRKGIFDVKELLDHHDKMMKMKREWLKFQ